MAEEKKEQKKNIAFFHPDLGIGGAERLIIDAAVGLQNRGHKVVIFTSYCDPQHCFDEARDGMLVPRLSGSHILTKSRDSRCARSRQWSSPGFHLLSIHDHMRHPTTIAPHPSYILYLRAEELCA